MQRHMIIITAFTMHGVNFQEEKREVYIRKKLQEKKNHQNQKSIHVKCLKKNYTVVYLHPKISRLCLIFFSHCLHSSVSKVL